MASHSHPLPLSATTASLAYTLADGTIDASDLPARMQVWWDTHAGTRLGLLTDQSGPLPGGADPAALVLLGRVAALSKCLADERVWAVTGSSSPPDLQAVCDELLFLPWQPVPVLVDGEPVAAGLVRYLGVDAVAGNAPGLACFVLVRPASDDNTWPDLVTTTACGDEA